VQFHLNGFAAGDPLRPKAATSAREHSIQNNLPNKTDVLIVGSGPAGLTLAAQLAAFPNITTCIVEQKPGPLERGQADGIACRSMEMFNAFGFADRVMREAYWVSETTFWQPDSVRPANIIRKGRVQDVEDGLSEFPHVILNQARVHDYFLEHMHCSSSRLQPDYSRKFLSLHVDTDGVSNPDEYPVTASFERLDADRKGQVAVRNAIGLTLHGDAANHAWGVMDVLAVTDFPDVRMKSLIRSAEHGSIIIIPREGGYLARFYVELGMLNEDQRVSDHNITVEQLIMTANHILHPYSLDVKEVAWWSVYEIGQRLCDKFDNVPMDKVHAQVPNVFIAGDACHTHSPKAGQGMNVSMRDSFNLGWKLISVLEKRSKPSLLHTYSDERQKVAKTLIAFDRDWSRIISSSAQSTNSVTDNANTEEFQDYFTQSGRYTAGTAIQYHASMLTGDAKYQHLAKGFTIGMRFHSAKVVRLADAKPMHLGHTIQADARWRLFLFADANLNGNSSSMLHTLCEFLLEDLSSPVNRYTRSGDDIDSVLDIRAVVQPHFRDLDINTMPTLLLPRKGRYKLIDYEKIFCSNPLHNIDIFAEREVDRDQGCMVLVRPDQHVAHVLPLDAFSELNAFFDSFMIEQAQR